MATSLALSLTNIADLRWLALVVAIRAPCSLRPGSRTGPHYSALGHARLYRMRPRHGRCTPDNRRLLRLDISAALGLTSGHQERETTRRVRQAYATARRHWMGPNVRA